MVEDLKRQFSDLINMVDGLHAIIVTDREGVPVLKVADDRATPVMALRLKFLSTSGTTLDQASKLGLSTNRTIVSMYSNYQVVCFNKLPLVVTLIASNSANTGMLLCLENDLEEVLGDIRTAVDVA
ncbi:Ragulator complex protein LAMTOR3 [Lamellibrachia satsuma]|nr:Ragulator complex protein LAMTOR3 [Lamellibrachia satsuma]